MIQCEYVDGQRVVYSDSMIGAYRRCPLAKNDVEAQFLMFSLPMNTNYFCLVIWDFSTASDPELSTFLVIVIKRASTS